MDINNPAPGTYQRRFRRGEPMRAVIIEDQTERDEDGDPVEDVRLLALVDGQPMPVDSVWPAQPISVAEYVELLERNRLAIGGNHPPMEPLPLLEEAADIVASYAFIAGTGEKIDAVKRITGLLKELDGERLAGSQAMREAITEHDRPYKEALANLENTKAALLAEIHGQRLQGETLKGRNASAFGRKVETLVVDDGAKVPRAYCKPDEALIKAALKAGQVVPGCRLDTTEATTVS